MSGADAGDGTEQLVAELLEELRTLQDELDPDRGLRPPTRRELALFTSDVAIPALVVLLRTNIRLLELFQRTLRMSNGRYDPDRADSETRARAERLGKTTLGALDDRLGQLQTALEGDDQTDELVARIRELQADLEERVEPDRERADADSGPDTESDAVDIDVETELRSLKDDRDDADSDET